MDTPNWHTHTHTSHTITPSTEYKLKLSLETARSPVSFAAAGGNTL